MRWILLIFLTLFATTVSAQNLLINPDFDDDPTVPGNGWLALGTGLFEWNQSIGDPSPPSARTHQVEAESMTLCQCIDVSGETGLDFSARSYTHGSSVPATNGVFLSVFPTQDCSGDPIETVTTDLTSVPGFYMRERLGYIFPINTLSARIELVSVANGTQNNISWDHVIVDAGFTNTHSKTWGSIKALYR